MKPSLLIAAAALASATGAYAVTSSATGIAPPPASAIASPKPIRTVSGGNPTARMALLDVRRTGRVLTVKLRLQVVRDPGRFPYQVRLMAQGGDPGTADGLRIYDDAGERTLLPLRDPDGGCSCSRGLGELLEGDAVGVFARFADPGGETVTLDAPGFPPFYDVPVRKMR